MDKDKDRGLEALNTVTNVEPIPQLIEVKLLVAKRGYTVDPAAFYEHYMGRNWRGIVHWRAILHYWNEQNKIQEGKGQLRSFKDFKERKGR